MYRDTSSVHYTYCTKTNNMYSAMSMTSVQFYDTVIIIIVSSNQEFPYVHAFFPSVIFFMESLIEQCAKQSR